MRIWCDDCGHIELDINYDSAASGGKSYCPCGTICSWESHVAPSIYNLVWVLYQTELKGKRTEPISRGGIGFVIASTLRPVVWALSTTPQNLDRLPAALRVKFTDAAEYFGLTPEVIVANWGYKDFRTALFTTVEVARP